MLIRGAIQRSLEDILDQGVLDKVRLERPSLSQVPEQLHMPLPLQLGVRIVPH